jgi:hypothetical protein
VAHSHERSIRNKQFHFPLSLVSEVESEEDALREMMFVTEREKGRIFGHFRDKGAVGDNASRIFFVVLNEMVEDAGLCFLIQ